MLKDIMVHLDQAPACRNRLEAAITLAKQHGARLTASMSIHRRGGTDGPATGGNP